MKIVLFGATGMIGQGALREVLADPAIARVVSVVRAPTATRDPKLHEIVQTDFLDLSAIEAALAGADACLFCLGTSSVGLSEAQYARVTYDYTLAAARTLSRLNPGMTFVYVSAVGADSSENGRVMWARVRGRTENDLFRLPFRRVYAVRPAMIRPLHGIRARVAYIDRVYRVLAPVLPLLQRLVPAYVTSTEELARAMLALAKHGGTARVVEARDIARLAAQAG
ncbi:NAD(P)H-binding protein [Methylobacterium sp. BTF04]|uniref:NAD(P)H-binding protein n=1 Tax=Methylobacterium sp. BTF04 TaxID=2708300 RepID=UPI0013D68387|nr:NAD(P)H-binding protein [Methylobacterium sp. BTF04]NEU13208.1 NAD(P)H-binding protein [Methylobacterium sp. BTF04]